LLFNALYDHFIGDIAGAGDKIAPCPYVPAPKGPIETLEFQHQFSRCLSFERLDEVTYREVGRHGYEEMYVILRDMTSYELNVIRFADFPDQVSCPQCNVSPKDWLAVLRNPHEMILDIVDGMARFPVGLHTASILKSSPEGEGFSPNPRG
jgi:hypothetical protein